MGTCCSKSVHVLRELLNCHCWLPKWAASHRPVSVSAQTEPAVFELIKTRNISFCSDEEAISKPRRTQRNVPTASFCGKGSLIPNFQASKSSDDLDQFNDILRVIERVQEICGRVNVEDQVSLLYSIGYLRSHCSILNNDIGVKNRRLSFVPPVPDENSEVDFWVSTFNGRKNQESGIRRFKKMALAVKTAITLAGSFSNRPGTTTFIDLQAPGDTGSGYVSYLKYYLYHWDFDQFEFDKLTNHHGISVLFKEILVLSHLVTEFQIDFEKLRNFCVAIEEGYDRHQNPYHNEIHGADVLQTTFCLISDTKMSNWFTNLEKLSMFFAAMVHDVEHTGTNNIFHQQTSSDLALLYNDKSILENHHVSTAFRLLQDPELNPFHLMTAVQFKSMRAMSVECVLATDMAVHFQQVTNLKSSSLDPVQITQQDMMNAILHCADISGPSKPWDIHENWTNLLMKEFFGQGDREKSLGIPISPLCDRFTTNIPESQIGFITYIATPAFTAMGDSIDALLRDKQEKEFVQKTGTQNQNHRGSVRRLPHLTSESDSKLTPIEEPTNGQVSNSNMRQISLVQGDGRNFFYRPIIRVWEKHFQKNLESWKERRAKLC